MSSLLDGLVIVWLIVQRGIPIWRHSHNHWYSFGNEQQEEHASTMMYVDKSENTRKIQESKQTREKRNQLAHGRFGWFVPERKP
jgi:hypothetical protein